MLWQLGNDGPLYRRVYDALRTAILDGRLPVDARLPGTRALAQELGVSRIVVLTAYEQLIAEGYVVATIGSGSRVAVQVPPLAAGVHRAKGKPEHRQVRVSLYARRAQLLSPLEAPGQQKSLARQVVDFRYTATAPDARTVQLWRQTLIRAAGRPRFDYPDPSGLAQLRLALSGYLRDQRGVIAAADDLLIVNGAQQGLDLTARVLCEPNVPVGIEDPHYQGTRQTLLAIGATLVPCAVDRDGLNIERHARTLRGVRLVCVTPSHQFPTGAVMTVERRLKLLQWAQRHNVWVVEDDYDSEFRYGAGAIPALQGLDSQARVVHIGTFGRTLFPGLRLGYLVVPPALRDAFRAVKWLTDRGSSELEQCALAAFIETGAYESARRRISRVLGEKRRTLLDALATHLRSEDVTWSEAATGTHVFLRLRRVKAGATDALVEYAERCGVRVYSGTPYHLRRPRCATLLCGYTTVPITGIALGIRRLAKAYDAFGDRKGG